MLHNQSIQTLNEHSAIIAFRASFVWSAAILAPCFDGCRRPSKAAEAWLRRRVRDDILATTIVDAYPTPPLSRPLFVGRPKGPRPDCEKLAYRLERRWAAAPRPTRVYWPARQFARLYGSWTGSDRLPAPDKVSHDLLVSWVWTRYLLRQPRLATRHWTAESRLQLEARTGRRAGAIPDALLVHKGRSTAIEVGGRYPAEKLHHHVRRFRAAGWRYVIW